MGRTVSYTLCYEADSRAVDLCKIMFGGDGSYYVTAPYHPLNRAVIAKMTINYAAGEQYNALSDALDVGVLDDEDKRLKLSHHPDGFLQFSGHGVLSGLDELRRPRGLGVFSWPLIKPTLGPSFSVAFSDPFALGRTSKKSGLRLVFREDEVEHMRTPSIRGLIVTGYYFPARWRELVYKLDGQWWLDLVQPHAQAVKRLKVVLASVESDFPGFLGLEVAPHDVNPGQEEPSFFISSSTGNLRRNAKGDLLGDQLVCMYPDMTDGEWTGRSLNYPLNDPPYTAPPGTPRLSD